MKNATIRRDRFAVSTKGNSTMGASLRINGELGGAA